MGSLLLGRLPDISVVDLRYLLAAAGADNFGHAAQALGLNTTTISRRISKLEDRLGVTLFERGHFGIRLTAAGKVVMVHVRKALDDIEAIIAAGQSTGEGLVGRIRLGVRMPPLGDPMQGLLGEWRAACPNVVLTLYEAGDAELRLALTERQIDAALVTRHSRWPGPANLPVYKEHLLAALPSGHPLCSVKMLAWAMLVEEPILTQEWEGSHTAREFFASLLGGGATFLAHSASKQSVLALVGAGFGLTLVTKSQSEASFPGVIFRPIDEVNAWVQIDLVWAANTEDAVLGRFIAFIRDRSHGSSRA